MIERFHRILKSAIKCHETTDWHDILAMVLLAMRSAFKEDINATTAEMVLGSTLRLPGDFFENTDTTKFNQVETLEKLRKIINKLKPTMASNHNSNEKIFVHKVLSNCTHAFVRNDAVRKP